ncbi:Hypp253 [Branchiostoma lanceolatum]|uniref:Hypp253 protein n=1 Tax=Branchiostoma lanceolatum TaxID=7740 RepID=A0A8J9YMW7_BRALA|nr:Hypp253 [Branchiostoma lanceolatum]
MSAGENKMASAGSTESSSTAVFVYPETGLRRKLRLKDATPKRLKQALKLPRYPDVLVDMEQDEAIFLDGDGIDSLFADLLANKEYEVQVEDAADTTDETSKKAPASAMPPRLSDKVGMDDIQRAMMCCQAIYQDGPERVVQFLNKPENLCLHNFGEVCVSRHGRLTYMLAETDDKDDLFIAFRGTQSYEDILSDLSIWQGSGTQGESAMGGKCHAGFLNLASCFPVDPILRKYVYSRDGDNYARIVVCGHSMGGAVAHIVTLNMLADLKRCGRDTDKVMSIAIGAPFFGDCEMRNYAEKHDLSDNLLTIVNQNDPVPRLLQLAEAFQCAKEVGTKKVQGVVKKALPTMRMSLQALSYTGIGGQALATAATAIASVDQLPAYLEYISQSLGSYAQALDDILKYTPLGWYMLITHYRPPGAGQKNQWHVSYIEAAEEVGQAMKEVGKMQWSVDRMNEHKISEYATVYPKTTVLGQPTKFDIELEVVRKSLDTSGLREKKPREVVQENPFKLTIDDVSLTMVGAEGSNKQTKLRIVVTGQNLKFFSLPEKPFTGIPADMTKGIETKVDADEVTLECELEANKLVDPVPKVHFTTHFEEKEISINTKQVKEAKGLTLSECVVNDLSPAQLVKAIQRSLSNILIMERASDRKKATDSDATLKLLIRLDAERKSVREGKDELKLKKMIDDAKTLDDLMENKDLYRVVGEILTEFGQYLEVKYPKRLAHMLMATFIGLVTIAGVVATGGGAAIFFGAIALGSGAGIGIGAGGAAVGFAGAGLNVWYQRQFRDYEQNYKAILRMLIKELPEPPRKQEGNINADDGTVYSLERALYTKYEGCGFLNKPIDEVMALDPFEDSPKLMDATEKSQREVLRRCQMACDLFAIRQILRKSCFVGLFGPQNAGKSTLIEKTWGVKVKERGFHIHTWSPDLYNVKGTDRMVIIDFPGTTTIDDQVANLANNCGGLSSILVLVMPFQGDSSTDHIAQLDKANKLAEDFDCSILLCISHCGRFKDILKDKEIVDELRANYTKHLKIDPANILFTELVETDVMEGRGVVGPEGVRTWLKDWLIKYDVFEEGDKELYAAINMTTG